MYTSAGCGYCVMAERLLRAKGIEQIEKIRVDLMPQQRVEMMNKTGRRTVPQIYIGEHYVGGYEELAALERAGKLNTLLEPAIHGLPQNNEKP